MNGLLGSEALKRNLLAIAAGTPRECKTSLTTVGTRVMAISKKRCPMSINGGELRDSAEVSEPETDGNRIAVTLSYNTPYAAVVHDRIVTESGAPINYTTPGTGAKYLEAPVLEASHTMAADLAALIDLKRAMG